MKKAIFTILALAIAAFASCYTYGSDSYKTTNCYENGKSESWTTYKTGNYTTTNYSNSDGKRGTTNQTTFSNGDYHRTYRNNDGYSSTTNKYGRCYTFRDSYGNYRTKCN